MNELKNGEKVLDAIETWLLFVLDAKSTATPAELEALPKVAKLYLNSRPEEFSVRLALASSGLPHGQRQ